MCRERGCYSRRQGDWLWVMFWRFYVCEAWGKAWVIWCIRHMGADAESYLAAGGVKSGISANREQVSLSLFRCTDKELCVEVPCSRAWKFLPPAGIRRLRVAADGRSNGNKGWKGEKPKMVKSSRRQVERIQRGYNPIYKATSQWCPNKEITER